MLQRQPQTHVDQYWCDDSTFLDRQAQTQEL
jgi:hypothetical protein